MFLLCEDEFNNPVAINPALVGSVEVSEESYNFKNEKGEKTKANFLEITLASGKSILVKAVFEQIVNVISEEAARLAGAKNPMKEAIEEAEKNLEEVQENGDPDKL